MYNTNRIAREYLLKNGYDQIWFKKHTRRKDIVWTQNGRYLATDLWNLFDGMCFTNDRHLVFFQVKTNAWPKTEEYNTFIQKYFSWDLCSGTQVLFLNVRKKNGLWIVETR